MGGKGAPVPEIGIWKLVSGAPCFGPQLILRGQNPPTTWFSAQIPAASQLGSFGLVTCKKLEQSIRGEFEPDIVSTLGTATNLPR